MDSGRFFQENILSNGLLTDLIFSNLTQADLLNCSLVTTKWTSPCRQFLYHCHPCLLRLHPNKRTDLEDIQNMLTSSKDMKYKGVSLNLRKLWNATKDEPFFKPILQNISVKVPEMKTVVIEDFGIHNYFNFPWDPTTCWLELLRIEEIETLKVEIEDPDHEMIWADFLVGERIFSNLKTFDAKYISPELDGFAEFLERCPALKEWCPGVHISHLPLFYDANKASVVKKLVIDKKYNGSLQLHEIQLAQLVLKAFEVYVEPAPEYFQLFWNIMNTSLSSLEELDLLLEWFKLLVRTGTTPLKNVKKLTIYNYGFQSTNGYLDGEMNEKISRDVDTKRMFPNATIDYWQGGMFC